jgi:hypothetical protein
MNEEPGRSAYARERWTSRVRFFVVELTFIEFIDTCSRSGTSSTPPVSPLRLFLPGSSALRIGR